MIIYNRPEIIEIMDPHYIFVNWGAMAPQPIANWNLPQAIVGARMPASIPYAPEVYGLQGILQHLFLVFMFL